MDEMLGTFVIIWICITTILSGAFVSSGSLDSKIVRICQEQGYWQTGQVRVICSVEKK